MCYDLAEVWAVVFGEGSVNLWWVWDKNISCCLCPQHKRSADES